MNIKRMNTGQRTLLILAGCFCGTLFDQGNLFAQSTAPIEQPDPVCNCDKAGSLARFSIEESTCEIPELSLQRADGTIVTARSELDHDGPILFQFAFTSCSTICPVLSSTSAQVQSELGDDASRLRMVTITIDPMHDTAAVLKEYANSLNAGEQWHFLTGTPENIAAVQKAFDAYTPNKSRHEALTFLRESNDKPWRRITGLISAKDLMGEVRAMISTDEAELENELEANHKTDASKTGDSK